MVLDYHSTSVSVPSHASSIMDSCAGVVAVGVSFDTAITLNRQPTTTKKRSGDEV